MRKNIVNKSKMEMSVLELCTNSAEVMEKIPQGKESLERLKEGLDKVMENQAKLDREDTTGVTEEKMMRRKVLIDAVVNNAVKIHASYVCIRFQIERNLRYLQTKQGRISKGNSNTRLITPKYIVP